jgi:hypothetical protein
VSTFAGTGKAASDDGGCASATFNGPFDIKIDSKDGSFLVADLNGGKIRKISPQGEYTLECTDEEKITYIRCGYYCNIS